METEGERRWRSLRKGLRRHQPPRRPALPFMEAGLLAGVPWERMILTSRASTDTWSKDDFAIVPHMSRVKDQKQSGYCWMYATALCVEQYANDPARGGGNDFVMSIAHLQYWDVLEKADALLHTVIATARREETQGRFMYKLLEMYPQDGGQWTFAMNLIRKHGFVDQRRYQRTVQAHNTGHLNRKLGRYLKSWVLHLRQLVRDGKPEEAEACRADVMAEVRQMVDLHLAPPPTPDERESRLQAGFLAAYDDPRDPFVSVIHDARSATARAPSGEPATRIQVDGLTNVAGASVAEFVRCESAADMWTWTCRQLLAGAPVWIGSSWSSDRCSKWDSLDGELFRDPFPGHPNSKMDSIFELGLLMGEHATVLVGVQPVGARDPSEVEEVLLQNSHGNTTKLPGQGYLRVTKRWFLENINIIVVPLSRLPTALQRAEAAVVVPLWDRIGQLALCDGRASGGA